MAITLLIDTGDEADRRSVTFTERVITIGRAPSSTLPFDMAGDREVSTRHAVIRRRGGAYVIADADSTNGTFVNGSRVRGTRDLDLGDVVNLGRTGPELRVAAIDDRTWIETIEMPNKLPPVHENPPWRMHPRVVDLIEAQTHALKLAVAGAIAGTLILGVFVWLYVGTLRADNTQEWREVTAPTIWRANDAAVALIETRIPGGTCGAGCEATGFGITRDGLIATNRHVVIEDGIQATSIRVKFANTRDWIPAHIERVPADNTIDVALIRLDEPGVYPAVVGVSTSGPDLGVGSAVITVGFPLGTGLKMQRIGAQTIAKTTMTLGSVDKVLLEEFQVDAWADHGSSGSPVFDRHGHTIGIVSGGAPTESQKVVYVVPADRIWTLRQSPDSSR